MKKQILFIIPLIILLSSCGSLLFGSKVINLLSPEQISLNKNWTLKKGFLLPLKRSVE